MRYPFFYVFLETFKYIVDLGKLRNDLKKKNVPQVLYFLFFLLYHVFLFLSLAIVWSNDAPSSVGSRLEYLVAEFSYYIRGPLFILIWILGSIGCYMPYRNLKNDFITHFICLSIPISIRYGILFFVCGLTFTYIATLGMAMESVSQFHFLIYAFLDGLFLALSIAVFATLYFQLKKMT